MSGKRTRKRWLKSSVFDERLTAIGITASLGEWIVANDALSQTTSIGRALGSRLGSETVQFKQACREFPHILLVPAFGLFQVVIVRVACPSHVIRIRAIRFV